MSLILPQRRALMSSRPPLQGFKRSLQRSVSGQSRTVINMVGDSTTAGDFAGTPSSGYSNNAYAGAVPAQLAALFVSNLGLPSMGQHVFGTAGGVGITTIGQYNSYNPALTIGSGWGLSSGLSLGGNIFVVGVTGSTLGLSSGSFDTAEYYYAISSSATTAAQITINGTVVGSVNLNNAVSNCGRLVASGVSGSVGIKAGASGNCYVIGLWAYNQSSKGCAVLNMGWGASTTANWVDPSPGGFAARFALALVPADLTIINIEINDYSGASPVNISNHQDNLAALVGIVRQKGSDVLLVSANRISTATTAQSVQDSFALSTKQVARALNTDYFDIASIQGFADYATANGNGYMGNALHPNAAGCGVIAAGLYNHLLAA